MNNHYRLAVSFGANLGKLGDAPATFDGTISYQNSNIVYGLAILSSANGGNPSIASTEVEGLIGYAITQEITHSGARPDLLYLSASSGIGVAAESVQYRRRRRQAFDPNTPPDTFVGGYAIPIRLQAIYEPYHFAGIGLTTFATFGALRPNYGVMATIMVGWF